MRAFDQANEEVIEAETKRINWQHYKEKMEESKAALTEELGRALPDMSSEQEALVVLLKRKIELLEAKITEMAEEGKQKIAEGLFLFYKQFYPLCSSFEETRRRITTVNGGKSSWFTRRERNTISTGT